MGHLWDGLSSAYDQLGFARAAGGDEVFRQLVLARIIEPTSKADSLRVLAEVGVDAVSYPTLNRRLRSYAAEGFRRKLAAACAAHAGLGPASLVLYDVLRGFCRRFSLLPTSRLWRDGWLIDGGRLRLREESPMSVSRTRTHREAA